jgi:ketosteroid isomerase-like protein
MLRTGLSIVLLLASTLITCGQTPAPDAAELTKLLNDFLAGASRSDVAMHERFWADDLIYTRSAGRRVNKAEVMRDVRSAPAPKPGDPKTTYTAEDVRIQQYGDTAIVAFRLVAKTEQQGTTHIANLLNSGTFLKRDGKWQVVNWQSTRMARPEEDAKREAIQAHNAFFQAIQNADVNKLSELLDQSFIVKHRNGGQDTRMTFINSIASGWLKYSKFEANHRVVIVNGDTAVVHGDSVQQQVATKVFSVDTKPVTAMYTLVFVYQGGLWKALALHTSKV